MADSSATVLALGPLTNIALLLSAHPELAHRITAIVAVAGQRPGQSFRVGNHPILHFHDMNVRKDPDAVESVLRSGIPLTLIPFEIGRQVSVSQDGLRTLRDRTPMETWPANDAERWRTFSEEILGASGFYPFDLLAVGFLRAPEQFTCMAIPAKLVRRHGLFVVQDTLEVSTAFSGSPIVQYCTEMSDALRRAHHTLLNRN